MICLQNEQNESIVNEFEWVYGNVYAYSTNIKRALQ